jgi:PPM family protein phosphatase
LNKTLFDIYYDSKKRDIKPKNGDSLKFFEIIEEQLVILCVSDGVGSLSKDWLASATTCRIFIENFIKESGAIETRMEIAVLAAHSDVITLSKQSSMAATLVAAVVDLNSDKIYYISIGDSRIFIVDNENAKLITIDDTTSIPVKVNNSIVIKDGIPLYTHPITKAIGQREKLEFEISSVPFKAGESVVLATDGIHNHSMLPNNILELLSLNNLSNKLLIAVNECSLENNDDATILILRRNDFPNGSKSLYQEAILKNLDFKLGKLYDHLLTDCAIELIEQSINNKDWETVKNCLEYIYANKLLPNRDILISWLDKIVEQQVNNRDILLNIRKLIQIS